MVSFVIFLVARTARIAWRTDRQTDNDKPSTVTLAAHSPRVNNNNNISRAEAMCLGTSGTWPRILATSDLAWSDQES